MNNDDEQDQKGQQQRFASHAPFYKKEKAEGTGSTLAEQEREEEYHRRKDEQREGELNLTRIQTMGWMILTFLWFWLPQYIPDWNEFETNVIKGENKLSLAFWIVFKLGIAFYFLRAALTGKSPWPDLKTVIKRLAILGLIAIGWSMLGLFKYL